MPGTFWSSTNATGRTPSRSIRRRARPSSRGRRLSSTHWPVRRTGPTRPGDVTTPNDVHVIVGAANLAESIRRYGHLAAQLDPLGSAPPGDPSLSPARTRHHRRRSESAAGVARRRPGRRVLGQRLRRDREAAARLLLDDRLRLRARVRARGARLAAPCRGVRTLPAADGSGERRGAARPHHAGRGVRAVSAPHVPGQDALLDRGRRHARAGPRRDHLRRGRPGRAPHDHRHGASRPAERARAHPPEAVRADPRRVQGPGRRSARCGSIWAGWAT